MKIVKKKLDDMYRCYCASNIYFDNQNHILLASEDPDVACNMYYGKDYETKENVWTHPGGCMSIVPIPGKEKEFLCVQEFYLKVTPSLSKIVWGKYDNGTWQFKDVVSVPYVHRFGIFNQNGINYLILATVATSKKEKNDWSVPGRIYVAELPEDPSTGVELEVLCGHIGEIATIDIDGDGQDEIMTIEEFHGNTIQIYKKDGSEYKKVWQYDNEIDFAHALVGAKLAGQNAFVCGVRRKDCELFVVTYEDGEYKVTMVDKGVGPANLCVVHEDNRDIIVGANHTAAEAAIYFVTED